MTTGCSEGLGLKAMARDYCEDRAPVAHADASEAMGIAQRKGLGRVRHIDTQTLWVQEAVRTGRITLKKVWGEVNPADLFTKHLPSREKVHQLMGLFGCEYRSGRAATAPLLRPLDVDGRQGDHPASNVLPTFLVKDEPPAHDPNILPHMYSEAEILRLFPTISAAAAPINVEDWKEVTEDDMGKADARGRRITANRIEKDEK